MHADTEWSFEKIANQESTALHLGRRKPYSGIGSVSWGSGLRFMLA